MQRLGLRCGLHQRLPCRSASPRHPPHILRPIWVYHSRFVCAHASTGSTDTPGAPSNSPDSGPSSDTSAAAPSGPTPSAAAAPMPATASPSALQAHQSQSQPQPQLHTTSSPPDGPAAAPAPNGAANGSASSSGATASPASSSFPPALPQPPAAAAQSASSSSAAASAPAAAGSAPGASSSSGPAAAFAPAAPSSPPPSSSPPSWLPPFLQRLLTWLASLLSAIQQFPAWVQMQHLSRLREAAEDRPWDADKHAAYLAELNRTNPREVVARVESQRGAVNAAVVVEYLKALIETGKVAELARADTAAIATANSAAAAAALDSMSPRTLSELLGHLQDQLAAAADPTAKSGQYSGLAAAGSPTDPASPGSGDAAAALTAVPLGAAGAGSWGLLRAADVPAGSLRRPLHVVVTGLPPGMLQAASGSPSASTASAAAPSPTPLLLRPLALLWRLICGALLLLVLGFMYLAGVQAIRRVQASGGVVGFPAAAAAPGPPVTAAGGGSGSSATSSPSGGGGGGPSVEPKEYKKDELPEKSIRTFKDVKGCDEAKEELREVVEFLKNPTKFTRLGAKLPKGVLLTGPPGTGKTLLAKAVAGEAGVPFFYRAGSEFEELYVGVGSRRMRALFAAAKKRAPCIVFIDEIDAIGGNRKAWENHTRKTLNQLLVEMDGFESTEGIIVMAATNLPESLDPALKRPGRFDRQVAVPLPDIKGRRDILEYYMSDKPLGQDVDRELIARQTQGFSGADLSNLINEGAILAAKEGSDTITQRMLDWAYDKILMGVERKSVKRTLEARRRTAFHEAGHALVALATPGASPIHKATIVPRGHALGMVTQVGREDEFSINRQQMLARIWVCMGGTVAEELVFGSDQVSSGATDDLRQATSMARHMVAECGMSPAIGPVYVAAHDERHGGAGVSEATRQRVDAEVAGLLAEAKAGVRTLLAERMQDLRTLAEALLDRETLTREEINSLLQTDQQPAQPPKTGGGATGGGGGGGGESGEPRLEDDVPAPAPAQAAAQSVVQAAAAAADSSTCSSSGGGMPASSSSSSCASSSSTNGGRYEGWRTREEGWEQREVSVGVWDDELEASRREAAERKGGAAGPSGRLGVRELVPERLYAFSPEVAWRRGTGSGGYEPTSVTSSASGWAAEEEAANWADGAAEADDADEVAGWRQRSGQGLRVEGLTGGWRWGAAGGAEAGAERGRGQSR